MVAHIGFLIDENLTPGLALTAQARGFRAFHAPWVGLGNTADAKIARYAISKNLIMVTNNLVDFRRIYKKKELHPGLILLKAIASDIMDRVTQHHIFGAALEKVLTYGEPINQTITVELSENADGDWLLQVRRAEVAGA